MEQMYENGSTVRVNCPACPQIHGRLGAILSYSETDKLYYVSIEVSPSKWHLYSNELERIA